MPQGWGKGSATDQAGGAASRGPTARLGYRAGGAGRNAHPRAGDLRAQVLQAQ